MSRVPFLLAASCLSMASAGPVLGQGDAPAGRRGPYPPLQYESADFWAEVHQWTGSEATRPPAQRPAARPREAAPAAPAVSFPDGARTVTTTAMARANVRAAPELTAPVVRSMPRGSVLQVFGEAPGGWFNVGETEPFGWVHERALQR